MSDNNSNATATATKQETPQLEQLIDNSAQDLEASRALSHFLNMPVKSGELLPPYWSPRRDIALFRFFMQCDQLQGVIKKINDRIITTRWQVVPRDATIKAHRNLAELYNFILFETAEFGQGFGDWQDKYYTDLQTQDNGAFSEIINSDGLPVNEATKGINIGFAMLDSGKCQRTGYPIYPVVFQSNKGLIAYHHTRIMHSSQQPSTVRAMNGVGRCLVTRGVNATQHMIDMAILKQEKGGSRPTTKIIIGKGGITKEAIGLAFTKASRSMDNQGLSRYSPNIVLGDKLTPDGDVSFVDMVGTDLFDERESSEISMAILALAAGVPIQDLWPAQRASSRGDAEFVHITGASGYQRLVNETIFLFSGHPNVRHPSKSFPKFLPPELKLITELLDDDQQERQANVKEKRSKTWSLQLADETIDNKTIRQLSLETGDINQHQFDSLELEDGRLPNGERADLLFLSNRPSMKLLLSIGLDDPLNIQANASQSAEIIIAINEQIIIVDGIIINSNSSPALQDSRQARRALELVRADYEKVILIEQQAELAEQEQQPQQPADETEDPTGGGAAAPKPFNPANNFRATPTPDNPDQVKQTTGANLPPEVAEYEEQVAELIEQATDGGINREEFEERLEELVIEFSTLIFLLGIDLNGEDLSDKERAALGAQIQISLDSIPGLADDVFDGKFVSESDGGAGNSIEARSLLWSGFLGSIFYSGMVFVRDLTREYMWVWNPDKDHCGDCEEQNGQIKTVLEWRRLFERGIYPKSPQLECHGLYCGCGFTEVS